MKHQDLLRGCAALMLSLTLVGCDEDRLSALQPPARHQPIVFMGRDFWHGFDLSSRYTPAKTGNPEFDNHPAFADAAICYQGEAKTPPAASGMAVWPTVGGWFLPDDPERWVVEKCPDPTRPFFLRRNGERLKTSWGSPVKIDHEAYRAWRAERPNLLYDGNIGEWCNDLSITWKIVAGEPGSVSPSLAPDSTNRFEALKAFMGKRPTTRYEQLDLLKRFFAMRKERNFGGKMAVCDAHLNTLHIAGDLGSTHLRVETTASGEYRYQPSAMFTRGAARQFGVTWEWYLASFMNGPSKFDKGFLGDCICNYPQTAKAAGAPHYAKPRKAPGYPGGVMRIGNSGREFGLSRSVFNRTQYLAYLSGANVLFLEAWFHIIKEWDKTLGKQGFSPRGRLHADFVDFSRAHPDRGAHYSPVAICVPLAQGYPTWGGSPFSEQRFGYTAGDKAVDAVFFTLVPGCDFGPCQARGEERLIQNSPYADMYDVIAPDASSQSPETMLDVMKSYRALVVVGDYRDRSWEKTLARYEAAGGRVVRVTPEMMADEIKSGKKRGIRRGEARYPKLEAALQKLQKDYFPFEVAGSCSYGLTVAKDHVWLYVFNNDGVIKFADAPQEFDESKASDVTVNLGSDNKKLEMKGVTELLSGKVVAVQGGAFRWHLGPGELAIFEIR